MTETPGNKQSAGAPSLEELARRLLDLWQDQLAAAAANPDLASQAARLMAAMPLPGMWLGQMGQMGLQSGAPMPAAGTDMAKAWAELARNWMHPTNLRGQTDGSREPGTARAAGTASAGPSTPAAASQPGGVELDELRARLAGLEKRLGELGKPAKPAKRQPAKRKPKSAGGSDARAGAGNPKGGSAGPDDGTAG